MRFTIVRDDAERRYDVTRTDEGLVRIVRKDDAGSTLEEVLVEASHFSNGRLHLLIAGSSHDGVVHLQNGSARSVMRGVSDQFGLLNEHQQAMHALDAASTGGSDPNISAPMSGKIIAVHVSLGQTVTAEDSLLVIEAMKMENIIRAPHDGTITAIDVAEGQAVEAGASLLVVTPDEAQDETPQ